MSGGFSSLNTALTALRYNRVAMDVAGSNIANVTTDGYARRRVEGAAVAGPTQPALWSRYDGAGDGVQVTGVTRMTDELLNVRARREHGNQAYLDVRQASLERHRERPRRARRLGRERRARRPAQLLARALAINPSSQSARAQVLSSARSVVDAIGVQARNIESRVGRPARPPAQRRRARSTRWPPGWPTPTRPSRRGSLNGSDVGVLLDKRDQLTLRLAELTGAKATVRSDGGADVTLNGVPLVTGSQAGSLTVASGVDPRRRQRRQPDHLRRRRRLRCHHRAVRHERRDRRTHRPAHHHAAGVPDRAQRRRQGPGRHRQHPAPGRVRRSRYGGHGDVHLRPHRRARHPVRRDHRPQPGGRLVGAGRRARRRQRQRARHRSGCRGRRTSDSSPGSAPRSSSRAAGPRTSRY